MPTGRQGSIHLFRFAGVDVFLHWSWFVVAIFEINARAGRYSSVAWNVLEYLALFVIVLLHEYGHALACRQVGGAANRIVLWPLGGVAYVDPPPRPGATLWSIAAGPLVNVALIPVLLLVGRVGRELGWPHAFPNFVTLLEAVFYINLVLLGFNILPIFPLDGGQILRALLWFLMGRARSLMVATIIGFVGVAAFILLALRIGSVWIGVVAVFMLLNCWGGMRHSLFLLRLAKLPRRQGFSCPSCGSSPPMGEFWVCGNCKAAFDTFATNAVCPYCAARFPATGCIECRKAHPIEEWAAPMVIAGKV